MKPSRNLRVSLSLVGLVAGMVALSFAAVPLYRVFCAATGYNGTTRRTESAAVAISDHARWCGSPHEAGTSRSNGPRARSNC